MRILIDTHILIWFLEGSEELSESHRDLLINIENDVVVSIASLWEVGIKVGLGKLTLRNSLPELVERMGAEQIDILPIRPEHIVQVSILPFHHRDPFDRMIVAQAQIDGLDLISNDSKFASYGLNVL